MPLDTYDHIFTQTHKALLMLVYLKSRWYLTFYNVAKLKRAVFCKVPQVPNICMVWGGAVHHHHAPFSNHCAHKVNLIQPRVI